MGNSQWKKKSPRNKSPKNVKARNQISDHNDGLHREQIPNRWRSIITYTMWETCTATQKAQLLLSYMPIVKFPPITVVTEWPPAAHLACRCGSEWWGWQLEIREWNMKRDTSKCPLKKWQGCRDASVDKVLATCVWRPEFTSQEPTQSHVWSGHL